ncbi:hypothetical protein ABZP36_023879 [Zizania latifolia]
MDDGGGGLAAHAEVDHHQHLPLYRDTPRPARSEGEAHRFEDTLEYARGFPSLTELYGGEDALADLMFSGDTEIDALARRADGFYYADLTRVTVINDILAGH